MRLPLNSQCLMIFTHSTCARISFSRFFCRFFVFVRALSLTPAVVIHSLKHVWASEYTTTAAAGAAAFAIYSRWISSSLLLLFDRLCRSHSVCSAFLLLLLRLLCSILCWSLALFILTFCPLSGCALFLFPHSGSSIPHNLTHSFSSHKCYVVHTATEGTRERELESEIVCMRARTHI